ncbi:Uncharacterized protein Adt_22682 [Abeliophyllum distichum]|uniref:C3H1-type domain-containing protein n=1 Tax=Abeliophyllum distichum TaxID=126358 RepID=A0ABD1S8S6_9LAMI
MAEIRKRRSLWDMEDETEPSAGMSGYNSLTWKKHHSSYDNGRDQEFSASENTNELVSIDDSGLPSSEPLQGNNVSLDFDELGHRNHNHTPEKDWSHSSRYPVRDRSRSRGRCRSRSSTRTRSHGRTRGQTRSRSPIRDHRRGSYRLNDRRGGSEKSSQSCKDFAAGRCRRASQCRLVHPNNINHKEGDCLENDKAEIWRNRTEHDRALQHANNRGFRSRDRGSYLYYGNDKQFRNRSRSTVCCKHFTRGRCTWGETCRFSHHVASADNYDIGTDNALFYKHRKHQSNGKPPCKYFVAGRCNRDNCRFPHDDDAPKLDGILGRAGGDTGNCSFYDKNKWSGPTRDDAIMVNEQEHLRIFPGSQSPYQDGISTHVGGQNSKKEVVRHDLSTTALQQNVSACSDFQQHHHRLVEDKVVNLFGSVTPGDVKHSRNTMVPVPLPRLVLNQNAEIMISGHSFISNGTDINKHMLGCNPSNGPDMDLYEPEQHTNPPLSILDSGYGSSKIEYHGSLQLKQQEFSTNSEVNGGNKTVVEECKVPEENKCSEQGKVEGAGTNKDEKGMSLFKYALFEFVKMILKPAWKEGRINREVHKTVVRKVVDKVITIQGDHIPKTQNTINQYLYDSEDKITKLVKEYVDRYSKTDS